MPTSNTATHPHFPTRDIRLASYLQARLGIAPDVTRIDGETCAFEFTGSAALYEEVRAFTLGEARVEPVAHDQARLTLRRRVDAVLSAARRDGVQ